MKPTIMDCTLRDGGLVNDFTFTDQFVRHLYETNVEAGVDYMEFGYKASERLFDRSAFGKWKFCREEDLREIVGNNPTSMKLSVMADIGRTDLADIPDKKDSVIDMIRIATYGHTMPEALEMIHCCHDRGYETTVNIMAVSRNTIQEIEQFLTLLAQSPVDAVYLVDSFGAFYPDQVRELTGLYMDYAQDSNKKVGFHAHNNQQLAFANTLEALHSGADLLDCTVNGIGRGAGNCASEMLLGYLEKSGFPCRELPILEFIEQDISALKREGCRWGYELPYLLTGQEQVHPSAAIHYIREGRSQLTKLYKEVAQAACCAG